MSSFGLTARTRIFCVGVATAFSVINNLDKLTVAIKELVGEQYHIHGVGLRPQRHEGVEMGSRTNSFPTHSNV